MFQHKALVLLTSVLAALATAVFPLPAPGAEPDAKPAEGTTKVSYDKQVRPIFQAHCQGCHQPAKPSGAYVMTAFDRMLAGGESKEAAIVPGKPEESFLIDQITPEDGKAEMPQGKPPLSKAELDLIRRWIAEGAVDDAPPSAGRKFDPEHPPVYTRPPVITVLDFSPDGTLLAVAGFHEVLLWKADGSELVDRLIGLAERIESVRFSPDGKKLAVTGGQPGRMGEVQVWDVAKRKLTLSVPVTFDTIYGASWSPDGTKLAFGCADNTVRAVDAKTGEAVLYQGAHNDWVLDTAFSKEGTHVVSVGRDMTVKLTELATQRFIDNVTSITPGALKGGIQAIARHPKLDHVLVGGSDGTPKVYRLFRETARIIGDDANLIFELFPMTGRIFSVGFSADGKRIAAGSSLDGAGEVSICSYEYDADVPANIKGIMGKVPGNRNPQERATLEEYKKKGTREVVRVAVPAGVYAVAFRSDGTQVAAAGSDGKVRLINAESGNIVKEFEPAPLGSEPPRPAATIASGPVEDESAEAEALPPGASITSLEVQPARIFLTGGFSYAQLLVLARLGNGETVDVTRLAQPTLSAPVVAISRSGLVQPRTDGRAMLKIGVSGKSAEIPVEVGGMLAERRADFVRDVAPVLSRLGCNAGTCHGSAKGKNGFKLSLRGYDPLFDVRALTDDLASRRVNVASPDDSLMLLKPAGTVPHVGGQLIRPGEPYYEIIRAWIAGGAKLDTNTSRVTKIEVFPTNPVVERIGSKQQLRVEATYADGRTRDVTHEAFLESGNSEVATASRGGVMSAVRRGEAPILARFEGAYAATTLTVMGDRSGFVWEQPPAYNTIDELTAAKWQRLKIKPSDLCTDAEFLRRVSLDLTGLPPTADEVRAFLADCRESRAKREALVDRLVGSPAYVEYWTNKWADLLQVNRKFLGTEGAKAFRQWIREEVAKETPYDEFARKVLTASGSNKANPPASYFKILRDPLSTMENTTHLFLGIRFNCNKCHDHPFERWTQDQYYQTAAFFAQVGMKKDPAGGDGTIGGSAVESGKPLYEIVEDAKTGEVKHDRTGQVTEPKFPFPVAFEAPPDAPRRTKLADWITSKDNPYFARSFVNRVWGYLFGVGIMEPIDDIRAGNPPTNPELLDYLTREFVEHGFDVRHVVRLVCKSRTYQLSFGTNQWNEDDKTNYSHAIARRLPAEVLYDTVYRVNGSVSKIPGVPPGTRAAELPDSGVELPSGFLSTFGRPVRESACECERSSGLQLGPVMALISGPTIGDAIDDPGNEVAKLVAREPDDAKLVEELFLRILNRPATPKEVETSVADLRAIEEDNTKLTAALAKREADYVAIRARQEKEREDAVAEAKKELAEYEKELAPKVAELEKQKAEKTARLEAEQKDYEATLPAKLADWEKKQASSEVEWLPLAPKSLKGGTGTTLTQEPDRSIVVSGKQQKTAYTIVVETRLRGITGIRLEALADPKLPGSGPGRAQNGNFVLTEFEVTAAPKADPKKAQKVVLQNPLADFSQENFGIKSAISGNPNTANKGWAVSPMLGVTHWATFETAEPIDFEGGTVLTFTLHQRYTDNMHMLGRFRLSATATPRPVGLGLPEELRALVATPAAERIESQKAALMKHFRLLDPEFRAKSDALAESRKPLPTDPKLVALRGALELASRPVPPDPELEQLRHDVAMSTKQLAEKRLTAAQDVAWALINSPAFLFNH
jgi:WD40 repeat protein/mono/diheme cytochrome c family protein